MRAAICAAVLLASACRPAPETTPSQAPSSAAVDDPPSERLEGDIPANISGEYRVAGIDGQALDAPYGIAVSIVADTISFEPRCLGYAWTYQLANGVVTIEHDPRYGPQRNADGTVTGCLPAVGPEHKQLARSFSAATQVRRTSDNALEFVGGGHSVTLFSQ